MKKLSLSLLIIIILAFFFRLIFLDRIPTGISNDELDYILNSKAVYLTGSDISQTWSPFSLTTPTSSFPQAELPPVLTSLFIGPLPLSLFWSKLPYVFISVATVGLLYLLTKKLIGETEALFVGLIGALNPWLIFFGRTAYDTPISIFFYLSALYILLIAKKWHILFAFPLLFLAFYSYIGAKIIFIPFAFVAIVFSWLRNKRYGVQYIILFTLCSLLFLLSAISILHNGARVGELSTPNMQQIIEIVNGERRLSIHTPLTTIFSNKYVVFGKYVLDKYFNAFSPKFLFLNGDGKSLFSVWYHGTFYYIDALFLLIGFGVLFKTNKKILGLLTLLIAIAPLPSVVSNVGESYAIRSFLLAPIFLIFIGVGLHYVLNKYRFSWLIIVPIYLLLLLNFINIYFLRNPIYNSESFSLSSRVLVKYLSLKGNNQVFVINGNPATPLKQYLFYTNSYNNSSKDEIAKQLKKGGSYIFNRINFIDCKSASGIPNDSLVIFDDVKCVSKSRNEAIIAQLNDGGRLYTINNDNICSSYRLSRYPYGITFSDLNIEKLSAKDFCEKFITRY